MPTDQEVQRIQSSVTKQTIPSIHLTQVMDWAQNLLQRNHNTRIEIAHKLLQTIHPQLYG